jgi:hypothetical protein
MWKLANLANGENDDLVSRQSTVAVPEDRMCRAEEKV